jgi:hypothetical protein
MAHTILTSDVAVSCAPLEDVSGCYRVKDNQIYISTEFDEQRQLYTLYHESFHFLMHEGELKEQERLAHQFALWSLGYKVSKRDASYFNKLINDMKTSK